ncbi:MAG: hypothetical protein ACRBDL_02265 [Alphaproteobacteria bacterium]
MSESGLNLQKVLLVSALLASTTAAEAKDYNDPVQAATSLAGANSVLRKGFALENSGRVADGQRIQDAAIKKLEDIRYNITHLFGEGVEGYGTYRHNNGKTYNFPIDCDLNYITTSTRQANRDVTITHDGQSATLKEGDKFISLAIKTTLRTLTPLHEQINGNANATALEQNMLRKGSEQGYYIGHHDTREIAAHFLKISNCDFEDANGNKITTGCKTLVSTHNVDWDTVNDEVNRVCKASLDDANEEIIYRTVQSLRGNEP